MSMTINLVEDHNIYLCEGGPVYNGGVQPTPITYLTRWKIVGNSEVHTLPYPDGVVLPDGYKRCKYLTFDGNSYINTGINLSNDIGFSLDLSTTTSNKTIIGSRDSNAYGVVFGYNWGYNNIYRTNFAYGVKPMAYTVQTNIDDGLIHHIVLDGQQAKIDNESVEIDRGNTFPQQPIFIGTWNNDGTVDNRMFIGKIYSVILYDSNGNLFNGIPCLDDNNVPCLYDTVSGTSFHNDGTGTFGYEIEPQPTEIWSCGEYSDVDNKYHIVILPTGKQAVDIVLDEPLRKTGNTSDTLEYPTETSGKALLTIRVEESGGELSPLDTPTTELVDAPQIKEVDSYTCVISQGGKAVEWSEFTTNSE